jgi:predicted RNase H-like nuclease (RuvC/YqgF family)
LQDLSKTYTLELAYQETIRKSDFIVQDEAARRLRLRILLLEDENDELHEHLAIEDDRIDELEQDCAELQRQVEHAENTSLRYETELRMKARELNNLKVRLLIRIIRLEADNGVGRTQLNERPVN